MIIWTVYLLQRKRQIKLTFLNWIHNISCPPQKTIKILKIIDLEVTHLK